MIVLTTIFWIIVGIIALYITILVCAFIYNGYLLVTGKMSKEELDYKVRLNKEKQKAEKAKMAKNKKYKYKDNLTWIHFPAPLNRWDFWN